MILAAGLGKRMLPLTQHTPKPLVKVGGKALLDYGIDALQAAGVNRIIVNVHHLGEQIVEHLEYRGGSEFDISDERTNLLDSGGGVKKALSKLGDDPFFVLNGDTFWLEGYKPNLKSLADAWIDASMDILLLLSGTTHTVGYNGNGDFTMDPEGRLERRGERNIAPFVYAGAAIIHPRAFEDTPNGAFSLNLLFDRAIETGRLYGVRMDGLWLHVGTPNAITEAEQAIARSAA